jgi:hypothetical protein
MPESGRSRSAAEAIPALHSDGPLPAYSVENLGGRILLENAKALERLKLERAEGSAISDDISSQSIVVRQGARLSLVFGRNFIYLRNHPYAGN